MSRRGALLGFAPAHSRRLGPGAQTHMTRSFAPLVCPFFHYHVPHHLASLHSRGVHRYWHCEYKHLKRPTVFLCFILVLCVRRRKYLHRLVPAGLSSLRRRYYPPSLSLSLSLLIHMYMHIYSGGTKLRLPPFFHQLHSIRPFAPLFTKLFLSFAPSLPFRSLSLSLYLPKSLFLARMHASSLPSKRGKD